MTSKTGSGPVLTGNLAGTVFVQYILEPTCLWLSSIGQYEPLVLLHGSIPSYFDGQLKGSIQKIKKFCYVENSLRLFTESNPLPYPMPTSSWPSSNILSKASPLQNQFEHGKIKECRPGEISEPLDSAGLWRSILLASDILSAGITVQSRETREWRLHQSNQTFFHSKLQITVFVASELLSSPSCGVICSWVMSRVSTIVSRVEVNSIL